MEESVPLRGTASGHRATFQNSEYPAGIHRHSEDVGSMNFNDSGRGTLSNGMPRQTEFVITAVEPEETARPERKADYKGRIRTWPGILLLVGLVGAAAALITLGALHEHDESKVREQQYEYDLQSSRRIQDGLNSSELISDDGQVGNPKKYPSMGCELPDYQSKNGQIYAVAKNGTEVPVGIKGVNWFGMETGNAIPFGLWENSQNGTTAYEIASFLARNKFNSVRLPICIKSVMTDLAPQKNLVNLNSNRALNITTYMSTLKTIIQSLAFRRVTVMISLHTLDTKSSGGAWYSEELGVSEEDFLGVVDKLTTELCNEDYWNILGLDLKNEPHECSWGGAEPDWQKGATLIGNRMLKGCPNWLAFVEGINKEHTFTLRGEKKSYFDWWGGGLQDADTNPVELSIANKVVYAPHYYNTGVTPQWYLYGPGGTRTAQNELKGYVELSDEDLRYNVNATLYDMFGYLSVKNKEAVVMGEFAGLYAKDKHPLKTTKRTTDFTIEGILSTGMAGGYMWSLNPESAYQFNPADSYGHYTEGLLLDDWLSPDKEFLQGMAALDQVKDLKMFPCFPTKTST